MKAAIGSTRSRSVSRISMLASHTSSLPCHVSRYVTICHVSDLNMPRQESLSPPTSWAASVSSSRPPSADTSSALGTRIVREVAKIISDRQFGPDDSSSMCAYLQGRCATVSSWSRAGLRWAGSMARTDTRLPGSCGTRAR